MPYSVVAAASLTECRRPRVNLVEDTLAGDQPSAAPRLPLVLEMHLEPVVRPELPLRREVDDGGAPHVVITPMSSALIRVCAVEIPDRPHIERPTSYHVRTLPIGIGIVRQLLY